jgi:hypothetical protein
MNCFSFDYLGEIQAAAEIDDIFWAGMEDLEKLAPAGKVLMRLMLDENAENGAVQRSLINVLEH